MSMHTENERQWHKTCSLKQLIFHSCRKKQKERGYCKSTWTKTCLRVCVVAFIYTHVPVPHPLQTKSLLCTVLQLLSNLTTWFPIVLIYIYIFFYCHNSACSVQWSCCEQVVTDSKWGKQYFLGTLSKYNIRCTEKTSKQIHTYTHAQK